MIEKNKVFAYITQGDRLLVFVERGFESFGNQVPAGTPEEGETLEEAVLREVEEETGLSELELVQYLGSVKDNQTKYGLDEIHHRHFFHIHCKESTPDCWSNQEKHPSIRLPNAPEEIIFEFRWIELRESRPQLSEGHDTFLGSLIAWLRHQTS